MPGRLLASIRQLASGSAPVEEAWKVLLGELGSLASRLRASRRSGGPPSPEPEDIVQDFVTEQLLSDDRAGLRYIAKTALTDKNVLALLRTMIRRHVCTGMPSLLANKRRTLRVVLAKPKYHVLPGHRDTHGPAGNLSPPPGDGEFALRMERWVRECPDVGVIRGDPDSSQLPLIVHAKDIERLVDHLFCLAGTCLRFTQIFAFVARALDLVHWDSVYRLQLMPPPEPVENAPVPEPADPTGDPSEPLVANLDRPVLTARAADLAEELTPVQRAYLLFQLDERRDGASLSDWLKQKGFSRSTFYEREHGPLRRLKETWRAEHPELPVLVLHQLQTLSCCRGGDGGQLTHRKSNGQQFPPKGRRRHQGDSTE